MLKEIQVHLIDMETLRNIDIPLVSSLLTLKRFHTFSQYFIVEFGKVFFAVYTSRDQNTDKTFQNMQAQVQIMPC